MVVFPWTCSNCFSVRSSVVVASAAAATVPSAFMRQLLACSFSSSFFPSSLCVCVYLYVLATLLLSFHTSSHGFNLLLLFLSRNLLPLSLVLLTLLLFYYVHGCCCFFSADLNDFFFIASI